MANYINRDDALAVARYSRDPVAGIESLPGIDQDSFIRLPCPIGGTLWRAKLTKRSRYYSGRAYVEKTTLKPSNFWSIVMEGEFGKTVFLTMEEAEAVVAKYLKELRES